MFGRKAKETASKWKDSEPKVEDVKVDAVDTGESFREKKGKVDVSDVDDGAGGKSFGQAFKEARKSGLSVFTWNGKSYNTDVKGGGSKPSANPKPSTAANPPPGSYGYKDAGRTPGGQRIRQTVLHQDTPEEKRARHDQIVASERAKLASRSRSATTPASIASNYIRTGGGPAAGLYAAGQLALGSKRKLYEDNSIFGGHSRTYGGRNVPPPNPAVDEYNRTVATAALKDAKQKQLIQQMSEGEPEDVAYAKGGSVGYSKMEKRHASWMKEHGAPKKMVAEESKEAKGMKCGGKVMKYAKGGGIESKGKTKGTMIRMASGGSVSARADGIAKKGKTKCKIC